jgi:protein SCO1/2
MPYHVVATLILAWLLAGNPCTAEEGRNTLLEQSKGVLQSRTEDVSTWVEEKTGGFLPMTTEFLDENGNSVALGELIDRPTIFLPIYYFCPNSCSRNLANLAVALTNLKAKAGEDYRVISMSFNAVETPADAARSKKNYVKILGSEFPREEWIFLTGTEQAITAATDSIGFRFKKLDDETFLHPSALVVAAADGKIIRYVYGSFVAGDIDMALIDAGRGTPSLSVKRLLDFCFNYDPDQNKSLFQMVKIGVLLFFVVAVSFVFFYFRRRDS